MSDRKSGTKARVVSLHGFSPPGPGERILRRHEVESVVGLRRSTIYQAMAEGRFPRSVRLGGRSVGWLSSEITEWLEALQRDYSHPSIIGWCPLNETWQVLGDEITDLDVVTQGMYLATKAFDTTRPALDTSGYSHRIREADIYDCHDYLQDPAAFDERHGGPDRYINSPSTQRLPDRWKNERNWSIPYDGQPFFVSEFGGIWWNPDAKEGEDSWGYGDRPKSIEEFYERFEKLCTTLLNNASMFGYCYTQLTDVFQEQNGIYRFDRSTKFDMQRIRQAQEQPAAIEP